MTGSVRRRVARGAALAAIAALAGACRSPDIRLAYAPAPGTVYRYAVHVVSTSTTVLSGRAPQRHADVLDFVAVDTVLAADQAGTRLRVEVSSGPRSLGSYVVRLDRQAALTGIDAENGQPLTAAGALQLQDLLPAVAGAPPDRPLRPGDRWQVNEPVQLPTLAAARLVGAGRLDALGVLDGRRVAETRATGSIELGPTASGSAGQVGLRGHETIFVTSARAVDDGAVERSTASTKGLFDILLLADGKAPLVTGQLVVNVSSTTRRL